MATLEQIENALTNPDLPPDVRQRAIATGKAMAGASWSPPTQGPRAMPSKAPPKMGAGEAFARNAREALPGTNAAWEPALVGAAGATANADNETRGKFQRQELASELEKKVAADAIKGGRTANVRREADLMRQMNEGHPGNVAEAALHGAADRQADNDKALSQGMRDQPTASAAGIGASLLGSKGKAFGAASEQLLSRFPRLGVLGSHLLGSAGIAGLFGMGQGPAPGGKSTLEDVESVLKRGAEAAPAGAAAGAFSGALAKAGGVAGAVMARKLHDPTSQDYTILPQLNEGGAAARVFGRRGVGPAEGETGKMYAEAVRPGAIAPVDVNKAFARKAAQSMKAESGAINDITNAKQAADLKAAGEAGDAVSTKTLLEKAIEHARARSTPEGEGIPTTAHAPIVNDVIKFLGKDGEFVPGPNHESSPGPTIDFPPDAPAHPDLVNLSEKDLAGLKTAPEPSKTVVDEARPTVAEQTRPEHVDDRMPDSGHNSTVLYRNKKGARAPEAGHLGRYHVDGPALPLATENPNPVKAINRKLTDAERGQLNKAREGHVETSIDFPAEPAVKPDVGDLGPETPGAPPHEDASPPPKHTPPAAHQIDLDPMVAHRAGLIDAEQARAAEATGHIYRVNPRNMNPEELHSYVRGLGKKADLVGSDAYKDFVAEAANLRGNKQTNQLHQEVERISRDRENLTGSSHAAIDPENQTQTDAIAGRIAMPHTASSAAKAASEASLVRHGMTPQQVRVARAVDTASNVKTGGINPFSTTGTVASQLRSTAGALRGEALSNAMQSPALRALLNRGVLTGGVPLWKLLQLKQTQGENR